MPKFNIKIDNPFTHLKNIQYVLYERLKGESILKYQITEIGNAYIEYKEALDKAEKFHKRIAILSSVISFIAILISIISLVLNKTTYVTLPPI